MEMDIVNLPSLELVKREEKNRVYHLYTETKGQPQQCPYCYSAKIVGYGRDEQVYVDLPIHGHYVAIHLSRRRCKCALCGKTFFEAIEDLDSKRLMTRRLVEYIEQEGIERSFTSIAKEVGINEKTVRNIFTDYIDCLKGNHVFQTPRCLGIDEVHIGKTPRCVFTNLDERTFVDMLPTRKLPFVEKAIKSLADNGEIVAACIDMWEPYRIAVRKTIPCATLVVDKFHVVKMANSAVDKVRRSLRATLEPKKRLSVMRNRHLLLSREHQLNDEKRQVLDEWFKEMPVLGKCYRAKERFYSIYGASNREDALAAVKDWQSSLHGDEEKAFRDVLTAFGNWETEILAYFEYPVTNAFTEGMNGIAKHINRMGRGYSFEAIRAKVLYRYGHHVIKKVPRLTVRQSLREPQAGSSIGIREVNFGVNVDTLLASLDAKYTKLEDADLDE